MIDKKINYKAIAMAIRNDLFQGDFNKDFDFAIRIYNKCKTIYEDEPIIDIIFKLFVMSKTSTNTYQILQRWGYKITNEQVSDTIFYRQCSDIEITLIAKTIYCTQHKTDFLEHQINVILEKGSIDIYEENVQEYKNEFGEEYLEYMEYPDKEFYEELK